MTSAVKTKKTKKKTSGLRWLRGRLRDLAKEADCYEEVKLNLMLEGWNLDDKPTKAAVRKWLTQNLSYYVNNSYFVRILGLDDCISGEQTARRCEVMRGLWEDVVGVKDKEAAKVGMLLVVESMAYGWNAATADTEDEGLKAVGKLVTWLGTVAW